MLKTLLVSVAVIAGVASASAFDRNGCDRHVVYTYGAAMKPADIAVHQSVQKAALCAEPTDPSWYIVASLVKYAQNPGGGDSGAGGK